VADQIMDKGGSSVRVR